jgi:hypothetical protein
MTRTARKVSVALVIVGALAAALVLPGCGPKPMELTYPSYQAPPPQDAKELKVLPVGMSGCMGAACHGAPAGKALAGEIDGATWQSSGSCWIAADPHTAAYSLLTDDPYRPVKVKAKDIMRHYAKDRPGAKATDEARCVACHTNPTLAAKNDAHTLALRQEGVSCEACHGNAGKWVSDHTTWTNDRGKHYDETGMVKLYDLGERAKNCLGCHVGAPADPERGLPVRDMNHDMIAAGHPRLNFDFAEYVRRLPKHWQEKNREAATPTPRELNPVKEWYVGRVAHAEVACALLKDRAERAEKGDEKSPWPEFAEFNCAACHHHLKIDEAKAPYANWRRSDTYPGDRPAGSIPWQMIWPITDAPGIAKPSRKESEVWPVLDVMEKPRPARFGDAKKVAADTLAKMHARRLEVVGWPDEKVLAEARGFFPTGSPTIPEWDTATQLFFGYAALDRAGKPSEELLKRYRDAVRVFRKQNDNQNQMPNWFEIEKAFKAIRPEN